MALDKSIASGKEKRKPRRGQPGCGPHGSCSWCSEGRMHKINKKKLTHKELLNEVMQEAEKKISEIYE